MVVHFIVLRNVVEIGPETHQDIFLGQRPKFLDWSCLLFCNLHFTQDPGVTLILKIQLLHPFWKQFDQDFYHNIAEKHGYMYSFTQKCAISKKTLKQMITRSKMSNSCDGFEANCGFSLVKLNGQKTHEEDPKTKYLIRQRIVTNLVWMSLNLERKLELES